MAENAKEIKIVPSAFFEGAEKLFEKVGVVGDELTWLQNQLASNRLTLFRVLEDGEFVGIFTSRWAKMFNGDRHLLIIHGVAVDERRNFLRLVQHPVKEIAKDLGCSAIQIHIKRPGLAHQLKVDGYEFQESIFVRKVGA